MPHELDNDLPAYLVYLILANIHRLREIQPDHILVKAVQDVLDTVPELVDPRQLEFNLGGVSLLRNQAE